MLYYNKRTFDNPRATELSLSLKNAFPKDRESFKRFLAINGMLKSGTMFFRGYKTTAELDDFIKQLERYIDELPTTMAVTTCKILQDGHIVFELQEKLPAAE